jgi:hypothetical protein
MQDYFFTVNTRRAAERGPLSVDVVAYEPAGARPIERGIAALQYLHKNVRLNGLLVS